MAARPSATTQAIGEAPLRDGVAGRGVTVASVAGSAAVTAGSGRCSSGSGAGDAESVVVSVIGAAM